MAVQDTDSPSSSRQDFDSLAAWIRLAHTPGLPRLAACQLLQKYHSPQAVLAAANTRLAAPPACNDAAPPPPAPRLEPPARNDAMPAPPGLHPAPPPGDDALPPLPTAEGAALALDCGDWFAAGAWPDGAPAGGERRQTPRRRLLRFDCDDDGLPLAMSLEAARLLGGPLPARQRALTEAALAWAQQPGNFLLTLDDPEYPPSLKHIADPPLLLYAKGRLALLQKEAVAVVGARNATGQGKSNARQFAGELAQAGMMVVSGLALGIDAAAHEGALDAGGDTVAVIGTGIDRIYPRRNAALARRIAQEGCLLSEFPLGTLARPENFPVRNRIIAGIARATLVVEAAARSGSLITAQAALDAGREVFVLPGSILAPQSVGCHKLIREGARLVAAPEHLLLDLGLEARQAQAVIEAADWLLAALGHDPVGADELASRLRLDPAAMQASLLSLELAGVVERLPGGGFQRLKGP